MNAVVEGKAKEVEALCRGRGVRRLMLFGSAARGAFDPASSDLDFVVEFLPATPAEHADNYFGLQDDLEKLFGVGVELVESGPIRNPYFREAIEKSQVLLYAAA